MRSRLIATTALATALTLGGAAGVAAADDFDPSKANVDDKRLTSWEFVKASFRDTYDLVVGTDSDGDGVSDWDERYHYGTDPYETDSDGDTIDDGDEVARGTDPANDDTDGDGVTDGDELLPPYNTDPTKADSDGDGLSDGDPDEPDPNNADSDGDGVSDWDEVKVYGTDPSLDDSDFDGIKDADEVRAGTVPWVTVRI